MNKRTKILVLFMLVCMGIFSLNLSAFAAYNDVDNNGTIDYLYNNWYDYDTHLNNANIGVMTVGHVAQCIDANQNNGNSGKEKLRVWTNTSGVENHFGSGYTAYLLRVRGYFWCYDTDDYFSLTAKYPTDSTTSLSWLFDVFNIPYSQIINRAVSYAMSSVNSYIYDNTGDGYNDYAWVEQRFPQSLTPRSQLNLPSGTSMSNAWSQNDTGAIFKFHYDEWRPSNYSQSAGTQASAYYLATDGVLSYTVWTQKSQVNHNLIAGPHV